MGVVNVTPDSFSDGGGSCDPRTRSRTAGGCSARAPTSSTSAASRRGPAPSRSTPRGGRARRPGGRARSPREGRVSIDTMKVEVAEAALAAGATYVNDVSAFRVEPELAGLVADARVECCLMHMRGEPRTMQDDPRYDDVVDDVKAHLEERMAFAIGEGVAEGRIHLDPGIGFGKTVEHNLELLRRLDEIVALGRPVVVGTSRKGFLGKLTGRDGRRPAARARSPRTSSRSPGGARIFRVHDVAPVRDALSVTAATVRARWPLTTTSTATTRPRRRRRGLRGRRRRVPDRRHHRDQRPVALHPPRGDGRRARDRPAPARRPDARGRRGRRDGHRPGRGHRRLRRGLQHGLARRPAALVQDARAPVDRDRRPAARPTTRSRRSR